MKPELVLGITLSLLNKFGLFVRPSVTQHELNTLAATLVGAGPRSWKSSRICLLMLASMPLTRPSHSACAFQRSAAIKGREERKIKFSCFPVSKQPQQRNQDRRPWGQFGLRTSSGCQSAEKTKEQNKTWASSQEVDYFLKEAKVRW